MKKIHVLISGSGSLYGVAIIQSLLKSDLALRLVACDINPRTLGLHLAHCGYMVPPVQLEEQYLKQLLTIIERENINAIFVASSKEIDFFSNHKAQIEKTTGARVFVNPPAVLEICCDKWHTVNFLKEQGFYFPRTLRYPEDQEQMDAFIEDVGFPLIVKPRRGAGSQGLYTANNVYEVYSLITGKTDIILQQYLPGDLGEFTTGICTGAKGNILSGITLKRYLQDGMTIAADLEDFTEITNYCKQVARVLKPYGPCNFQSRLLKGKPYIFEINPRFSSSTGMRSLLGVNEAEILLRAEILGQKITEPPILKCSVIRQYTDYLVSSEQIQLLEKQNFCITPPNSSGDGS